MAGNKAKIDKKLKARSAGKRAANKPHQAITTRAATFASCLLWPPSPSEITAIAVRAALRQARKFSKDRSRIRRPASFVNTRDGHRRLLWLGKAQGAGAFSPSTSLAFDGFGAS